MEQINMEKNILRCVALLHETIPIIENADLPFKTSYELLYLISNTVGTLDCIVSQCQKKQHIHIPTITNVDCIELDELSIQGGNHE
ncbi:MAG: hypothetical protein R3Y45_07985 [Bacillota bacterium]